MKKFRALVILVLYALGATSGLSASLLLETLAPSSVASISVVASAAPWVFASVFCFVAAVHLTMQALLRR